MSYRTCSPFAYILLSILLIVYFKKNVYESVTTFKIISLFPDSEILNLLMENIKNLCSYTLRAFQNVPKLEVDTDDDEKSETEDIVIVPPTHTSQAKFCQKLRKFAKNNFGLQLETPQTPPKPVIVTSPAKNWIKLQQNKKKHNGHVMINGAKMARDQIVKTTLRPSLTCPFKTNSDFVVKLGELPTAKVTLTDINKKVNTGNGCRCGNATSNPGKLTCGGQRCPCYTNAKSCIECKCKGCRNPHQANGIKVIRPHLQLKNKKIFIGPGANPPLVSSSQNHPNSMTTIRRIHLN